MDGRAITGWALLALGLCIAACGEGQPAEPETGQLAESGSPHPTPASPAPDVTISIEGVGEIPMFLNPNDRVVTPKIRDSRIWEPTETRWFVRSLRAGDVVVDVGALNGFENVVVEQKAVSNEAGSLRLYLADRNKGDHRIFQVEGEPRPHVDVEAVALDDYFGDRVRDVDFVKIDTQGAEMVILQGMDRILRAS